MVKDIQYFSEKKMNAKFANDFKNQLPSHLKSSFQKVYSRGPLCVLQGYRGPKKLLAKDQSGDSQILQSKGGIQQIKFRYGMSKKVVPLFVLYPIDLFRRYIWDSLFFDEQTGQLLSHDSEKARQKLRQKRTQQRERRERMQREERMMNSLLQKKMKEEKKKKEQEQQSLINNLKDFLQKNDDVEALKTLLNQLKKLQKEKMHQCTQKIQVLKKATQLKIGKLQVQEEIQKSESKQLFIKAKQYASDELILMDKFNFLDSQDKRKTTSDQINYIKQLLEEKQKNEKMENKVFHLGEGKKIEEKKNIFDDSQEEFKKCQQLVFQS